MRPTDSAVALEEAVIDGEVIFPNGVTGDIVAELGVAASIYGWSSSDTGKGNTRAALRELKDYGGGNLIVHDPGEVDSESWNYWKKMVGEGLVTEVHNDENIEVTAAMRTKAPRP